MFSLALRLARLSRLAGDCSCDRSESAPPAEASPTALYEIELAFNERVEYIATLDDQYQKALKVIRTL